MSVYIGINSNTVCCVTPSISRQRVIEIAKSEFAPKIGDLRYLMRKTLLAIDIDSPIFDGWVYADGREYSRQNFPAACNRFAGETADRFNVPDMRDFILPVSQKTQETYHSAYIECPLHYHAVDTQIEYQADAVLSSAFKLGQSTLDTTPCFITQNPTTGGITDIALKDTTYSKYLKTDDYKDYVPTMHSAGASVNSKDRIKKTDLTIPMNVAFNVLDCATTGGYSPSAVYPTHIRLQIMVYIGRNIRNG